VLVTEKIPAKKARQGRSNPRMAIVLVVALVLALVVWGGVEWYGETIVQNDPGQQNGQLAK
jgi:hypothetical protein